MKTVTRWLADWSTTTQRNSQRSSVAPPATCRLPWAPATTARVCIGTTSFCSGAEAAPATTRRRGRGPPRAVARHAHGWWRGAPGRRGSRRTRAAVRGTPVHAVRALQRVAGGVQLLGRGRRPLRRRCAGAAALGRTSSYGGPAGVVGARSGGHDARGVHPARPPAAGRAGVLAALLNHLPGVRLFFSCASFLSPPRRGT